jgi:hypothetical protein
MNMVFASNNKRRQKASIGAKNQKKTNTYILYKDAHDTILDPDPRNIVSVPKAVSKDLVPPCWPMFANISSCHQPLHYS